MAGRINEEDIALVRERTRIDDVVSSYVTLRPAGGGSLKGLCPFHDEKTPSFQVTPSRGFFYCFGCGEGGDAIKFLQQIGNLSFTEAVQQLADRCGVQLRVTEQDGNASSQEPGLRRRIHEANAAAEEFYRRMLMSPDALAARQMLDARGFDKAAAEHFGVGYAPRGGRELKNHLNRMGFKDAELVKAGLIREHGHDFFQGRVLWPIRESGSQVVGFGARRLFDDDRMPAKYLNTPETPVYKKSHVLYGLDLARRNIGKKGQAVVVEGYTDVMAAHLSGVDTAVASCGTAFGDDHARMLQRLMGNQGALTGEVVFTFDGDQAGQNAALKVFAGDANFTAQTYVAVEPSGLDPCDLRLQQGEAAVRELVGRRVPLYRFVMENTVKRYDLDRVDGRLQALRAAAPLVSSIRDTSLVNGYLRELAAQLGMDIDEVRAEVQRAQRRGTDQHRQEQHRAGAQQGSGQSRGPEGGGPGSGDGGAGSAPQGQKGGGMPWPEASDRTLGVERGTLKLMLQYPTLFDTAWDGVSADDFTHPAYRAVFDAITQVPWQAERWTELVREATTDETVRQLEIALLVEPVFRAPDEPYATAYASRLMLLSADRSIRDLKSKLQRTNPVDDPGRHKQMFSELLGLEVRRKQLQQASVGALD